MFADPLFQIKLSLLGTVLLSVLKLPVSSEIHWVSQYLVHFTGLAGIENATAHKTNRAYFHRSRAWQIVLIFKCDRQVDISGS